jgi:hypothetical protein
LYFAGLTPDWADLKNKGEEAGGKSGKKKEFPGFMEIMHPGNSYSPDLRCFY